MNIKKILFIIAGLLILGAIGGTLASILSKPGVKAAGIKKKDVPEAPREALALEEFVVNLADTKEPHYLKAVVVLEVAKDPKGGGEGKDAFKEVTPRIRDAIITTLCRRRFSDLISTEGKQDLKKSIREDVNQAMGKELVFEVYFTSFAMQ